MPYVVDKARGRTVLHIGCVDSGLAVDRLKSGELLHPMLADVAADIAGIDIDEDGLKLLRDHGFGSLVHGDVTCPSWVDDVRQLDYDLVVASEVVEHLSNPGAFLQALATLRVAPDAALLITVPSPFAPGVLLSLLNNEELVHPDHVCWYSYRTIRNLIERAGFEVRRTIPYTLESARLLPSSWSSRRTPMGEAVMVPSGASRRGVGHVVRTLSRRLLVAALMRRSPWWSNGIVVECGWPKPQTLVQ